MAKRRAAMMLAVIQAELDHEKLFAKRLKQAEEYKKKDASEEDSLSSSSSSSSSSSDDDDEHHRPQVQGAKLLNIAPVANIVKGERLKQKAGKWRLKARSKTLTRLDKWETEDHKAKNSDENRDVDGNLLIRLRLHSLEPNIGTNEGGGIITLRGEGFDVKSFQEGRLWVKWGQYRIPILDFVNFREITCRQPPVPTLHTQDMRRRNTEEGTFEEYMYFDVCITNDQGITFSESKPFYIMPQISETTMTMLYDPLDDPIKKSNLLLKKERGKVKQEQKLAKAQLHQEKEEMKKIEKIQKEHRKHRKHNKKHNNKHNKTVPSDEKKDHNTARNKTSRKTFSSKFSAMSLGSTAKRISTAAKFVTNKLNLTTSDIKKAKKNIDSKKKKELVLKATEINGVVVWGTNAKNNALKVGTDLISSGLDGLVGMATGEHSVSKNATKEDENKHPDIKSRSKIRNNLTMHLKGSPLPHPRYLQFRTCLRIIRLLSICTGGLIHFHGKSTTQLQFIFADQMDKLLSIKKKKINKKLNKKDSWKLPTLADLVVLTILKYESKRTKETNPTNSFVSGSPFPLEPVTVHMKTLTIFFEDESVVNYINFVIERDHLIFQKDINMVRNVQITTNLTSHSDAAVQMALHEDGSVSIRCDSSVPSMYAQDVHMKQPFIPQTNRNAKDQHVTVNEIRIPMHDATTPPSVNANPNPSVPIVPMRPVKYTNYAQEQDWLDNMESYIATVERLLWSYTNRELHGRARKTNSCGNIVPPPKHFLKPGSGWFFAKTLSFHKQHQKIEFIACGAEHFCAVTSKSDGSQLYTWGNNKHGQLGRDIGKANHDVNPGIVEFLAVDESMLENNTKTTTKEKYGGCFEEDLELRPMYVTHISCGPEYTVCSGLGSHDGVASVFSWGKTHTRARRVLGHIKFRTVDENQYVSNLACGVPHDASKELPQEVIRFRPHHTLSSAMISALKIKTRGSNCNTMSMPLLFFPLRLSQFYKSEWKRWMFDHRPAVKKEIVKSKYSAWHRAVEGRFKRLSNRAIPVLEQKEKVLFESFATDLQKFGESCDRAAVMKQRVIKDVSEILQIPFHYNEQESTIPVDDVILAFVQEARRCDTISTLEPLCFHDSNFNVSHEKETKVQSKEGNHTKKTLNTTTTGNGTDNKHKRHAIRGMRDMMHKKTYTIPNDVAWADILNCKQDAEADFALGEVAFSELWHEYCLVCQEQLKLRTYYAAMKTNQVRKECLKGIRPGFKKVDPQLFYKLLLETVVNKTKQKKETKKLFEQRSKTRRSTVTTNPRAKGGGIRLSKMSATKKDDSTSTGHSSRGDGRNKSGEFGATQAQRKDRYNTANIYNTTVSISELALRTTSVWNNKVATLNPSAWQTWTTASVTKSLIKNIQESNPCPFIDELDNVLDLLVIHMREMSDQMKQILRKGMVVEKSMYDSLKMIELYESCAEDWIVSEIIDQDLGELPDSHVHFKGETDRLHINTSTRYVHQAYKESPSKRTGFQNRLEVLQNHWTKSNEECMITGQYGLAKKFLKHVKQMNKEKDDVRHERMLQKHLQREESRKNGTGTNGGIGSANNTWGNGTSNGQVSQHQDRVANSTTAGVKGIGRALLAFGGSKNKVEETKKQYRANESNTNGEEAHRTEAFIHGSNYCLDDFLNMSNSVLKYHKQALDAMQDTISDGDHLMKYVIDMIEDTGNLRTVANVWAQEQCNSAKHNLNDLETFVPERAKHQWEKERVQVMKIAGNNGKVRRNRMVGGRQGGASRRRSQTMEKLRVFQKSSTNKDAPFSFQSLTGVDAGEGGTGSGRSSGGGLVYSSLEDTTDGVEEPPTDGEEYHIRNSQGHIIDHFKPDSEFSSSNEN